MHRLLLAMTRPARRTLLLTVLSVLAAASLVLPAVNPVSAAGGVTVLANSAQVDFPMKITFNLSAQGDTNITDVRLQYNVERVSHSQVTAESFIDFTPAPKIDVSWLWDLRKVGGLPPGTGVNYWWVITDSSGKKTTTPPSRVQFDDNRYTWQAINEGKITLLWYKENEAFARELMAASQQALSRLAQSAGASIERQVKIYIYPDAQALRGAMINPQEWTGGVTFPSYSTIAIGISKQNLTWGKRAIAHEFTHQVMFQMTDNPYSGLPTWLDEGFAMYGEGDLEPQYQSVLDRAVSQGKLISVRSLASPFSALTDVSYQSYAESYSIVNFLIRSYGQQNMLKLLQTFKEGATYDGALLKVYGFDMDGLNALWQKSLTTKSTARLPSPAMAFYPEPAIAF